MRKELNTIQWCPWCGDYIILSVIRNALKELGIPKENVVTVSGIWCSWKITHYIDGYAAETLHGRTLPFATWVKLANPELTVIAIWWDGDGYWIGLGHFMHAARRDINITYLVCDNENYGLTTGQASPTTPLWTITKSTPSWNQLNPLDPIKMAEAAGCKFTKNVDSKNVVWLKESIKNAITHPWFSHLNILQNCPSWKRW